MSQFFYLEGPCETAPWARRSWRRRHPTRIRRGCDVVVSKIFYTLSAARNEPLFSKILLSFWKNLILICRQTVLIEEYQFWFVPSCRQGRVLQGTRTTQQERSLKNPLCKPQAEVDFAYVYNLLFTWLQDASSSISLINFNVFPFNPIFAL